MKESFRKRLLRQRFLRPQKSVRKGGRGWGEKSVAGANIPKSENSHAQQYRNTGEV